MNKHEKYIKYTYKASRFLGWLIIIFLLVIVSLILLQPTGGLSILLALQMGISSGLTSPIELIITHAPKIIYPILLIIIAAQIKKSQDDLNKVSKKILYLMILNIVALFLGGGLLAAVLIGYSIYTRYLINKYKKS